MPHCATPSLLALLSSPSLALGRLCALYCYFYSHLSPPFPFSALLASLFRPLPVLHSNCPP